MVSLPWNVIAVFDPTGNGNDFAYTVGLIGAGAPAELHVWARATDGHDPGDGWKLSPVDQQRLLNTVSDELVAGTKTHDDMWTDTMDGGFTTITWSFGPPTTAPDLDTLQLDDTTAVWPLRWSLERRTFRPGDTAITPDNDDVAATAQRYADAAADRADIWDCNYEPVDVDATHGPWAAVIGEIRAGARSAAGTRMDVICAAVQVTHMLRYTLGVAAGAARSCGRTDSFDAALRSATDDAAWIVVEGGIADDDDHNYVQAFTKHIELVLAATYGSWVVADIVTPDNSPSMIGMFDVFADPASASTLFAAHWGGPAIDADTPSTSAAPHDTDELDEAYSDLWVAALQVAILGYGAPVIASLVPGWETIVDTGVSAETAELDRYATAQRTASGTSS